MYFLVVPAAVSNANNEAQKTITDIGNQLDTKTSRIQELETQMEALQTSGNRLQVRRGLCNILCLQISSGRCQQTVDSL